MVTLEQINDKLAEYAEQHGTPPNVITVNQEYLDVLKTDDLNCIFHPDGEITYKGILVINAGVQGLYMRNLESLTRMPCARHLDSKTRYI